MKLASKVIFILLARKCDICKFNQETISTFFQILLDKLKIKPALRAEYKYFYITNKEM